MPMNRSTDDGTAVEEVSYVRKGLFALEEEHRLHLRNAIKLDISDNLMPSFKSLHNLSLTLEHLVADRNNIESVAGVYWLNSLPNLASLSLVDNPVQKVEGYRAIIIKLLPSLTVLDKMPITPEEKVESDKYCFRNYSSMPTMLNSVNTIRLSNTILSFLHLKKQELMADDVVKSSYEQLDYHKVMKEVGRSFKELAKSKEIEWSVEILEDIDTLHREKSGVEFAYDKAVIQMLNRQIERIQQLKEQIDSSIAEYNSLLNEQFQDSSLRTYELAAASDDRLFRTLGASSGEARSDLQRSVHTVAARPVSLVSQLTAPAPRQPLERLPEKAPRHSDVTVQRSRQPSLSPEVRSMASGQQRVDELILSCYAKDKQISDVVSQNTANKAELRRVDEKIRQLKERQGEIRNLERIKQRLAQEADSLREKVGSAEEQEQRMNGLQLEIRELKSEAEDLQRAIRQHLEEQTGREMADQLRDYHLKVNLFIGVRGFLRAKKVDKLVDEFRQDHLKVGMIRQWKAARAESRRKRLLHEKVGVRAHRDAPAEEVEAEIIKKFRDLRRPAWLKFYLQVLGQHAQDCSEQEQYLAAADKYNKKRCQRLVLNALKEESARYAESPVCERIKLIKAEDRLHQKRLERLWREWKELSQARLKPAMAGALQMAQTRDRSLLRKAVESLQADLRRKKEALQTVKNNNPTWLLRDFLNRWRAGCRKVQQKGDHARRRLQYFRKRRCWKALCWGVENERAEKEQERKATHTDSRTKVRELHDTKRRVEEEEATNERQENLATDFRRGRLMKWLWTSLVLTSSKNKAAKNLNDIFKIKEAREGYDGLYESIKNSEREELIELGLQKLKASTKERRKALFLQLFRLAARESRVEEEKLANFQQQARTACLRRLWRAFQHSLLQGMGEKTRLLHRDILEGGEQDKRDVRSKVSLANENEFMKSENREAEARLQEKRQKVDASKAQLRRLDEAKTSLSIKIELLEKDLADKREQAVERRRAMETELETRRAKVAVLKASAEELEGEIRGLDRHLEGSAPITSDVNQLIRDESRDKDICLEEHAAIRQQFAQEVQQVTSEVDELKARIREHDGVIESLASVKQRKEEEVVHLQKLIASLKNRRLENILISRDRIDRQESSLRSFDAEQARLAAQKEELLRAERAFKARAHPAHPPIFSSARPADLLASERRPALQLASKHAPDGGDQLPVGTARFPTLDRYLSPKGSGLSLARQSEEEPTSHSQRQAPVRRFEPNAGLKLRANMMLDSIDKDLKRLYK